jgi:hypothetical protein
MVPTWALVLFRDTALLLRVLFACQHMICILSQDVMGVNYN